MKFVHALLILALALTLAPIQPSLSSPEQPAEFVPAPIPGAPKPTIQVVPAHGQPGAAISVSGLGVAPYPGVRLAWLDDETTATLRVVDLGAGGGYSAEVQVPSSAVPGSAQICAAVTGTDQAAFACVNFTVDAPAPGSLSGQLPLGAAAASTGGSQALDARVQLTDRQGLVVASAPVQSNGSFSLPNVPPGAYTAGVTGVVPVLVQSAPVIISSGNNTTYTPTPYAQCVKGAVTAVRLTPTGKPGPGFDFGSYVNYWPYTEAGPKVGFEVDMQILDGASLGLMPIRTDRNDGTTGLFAAVDPPATGTTYVYARWVADVDAGIRTFSFEPGVSLSGQPGCTIETASRKVNIIEHPLQKNALQGYVDRRVTDLVWDGSQFVFDTKIHSSYDGYEFLIPIFSIDGEKKLPAVFPDPAPTLPFLGKMENNLGGAAFNITGAFDLDGNVTLRAVRLGSRADLLRFPSIVNGYTPLFPEGGSLPVGALSTSGPAGVPVFQAQSVTNLVDELRQIEYAVPPTTLYQFDEEMKVFGQDLGSAGMVAFSMSVYLGVSGEMVYEATLRPLAPAVDALATANVRPRVTVVMKMDALYGVASAGMATTTEAEIRLPVQMDSQDSRFIWMVDPCFRIKVLAYVFARINLLVFSAQWNSEPWTLVDYAEGLCSPALQQAAAPQQTLPRLLVAPNATAGPGGRLLTVYVEDTAPAATIPSPKVMARFWDAQAGQWGAAVALTDGSRMVQDPVGAFYGPDGRAMVAWTQNPMTQAEEQAALNDLNAVLKRQEIYYATWNGSAWSAPQRLTDDQLPDGLAAIAGDETGITLAWVRDTDGDLATRTDWRIAVQEWDAAGSTWSALTLLNGSSQPASNYQVSADRQSVAGVSHRVLAWTRDNDGDVSTNLERQIDVFDYDHATMSWKKDPTINLPLRSEGPVVGYLPGGQDLYLAFLQRPINEDGSAGGMGNQARLYTARRTSGSGWDDFAVLDEAGAAVRAEQPRLDVGPAGEALVVFRRFGTVATNAELGQMAYTPLKPTGEAFPPLYLTDDPAERWQPTIAINTDTEEAVVVNVNRTAAAAAAQGAGLLQPASPGARPSYTTAQLSTTDETIESTVIEPGADPALDPALELSAYHAAPGATVTITTTVRNLGRAQAAGVKVRLYSGQAPGGTLVQEVTVGTLDFNESAAVAFDLAAAGGTQPVYTRVTAATGNLDTGNDTAAGALGDIPAPTLVKVLPHPDEPTALQVAWQAPGVPGIAGYRILRSATPGGPYELVGETANTIFADLGLQGGAAYYYVVQAFDASGLVSAPSEEAAHTLASFAQFMPTIRR